MGLPGDPVFMILSRHPGGLALAIDRDEAGNAVSGRPMASLAHLLQGGLHQGSQRRARGRGVATKESAMKKSNGLKVSLLAAAVAIGVGSTALGQDDDVQTEEVQRAAEQLERAEDRLESSEEVVEQREEELEEAIAEAADSDPPASSDRPFGDALEWDELTEEHANLSTFVEALRLTGLDDTLSSGTVYTVFAPINDAFDEDREDLLDEDNREELIELLRAHIVADDVDPDRARTLDEALTVDGGTVDISVEDGELMVGDATVVDSDIHRGNLRIYPIDELLEADPSDSSIAFGDFDEE